MDLVVCFMILFRLFTVVNGKNASTKHYHKKIFQRQMIIPNKFIPMLKESALFKSRLSSNDLSQFLKPKSRDEETGKTRQNLMNALGMDAGAPEGAMGGGGMGLGQMGGGEMGLGQMGGGGMGLGQMGGGEMGLGQMGGGGLPTIGGSMSSLNGGEGGSEGMGSEMSNGEGLEGRMSGGMAGLAGMNGMSGINDMGAMNGMGGLQGPGAGRNPLESIIRGNNAMNPMSNAAPEGMMSDANQLPAGDPMAALKSMMDTQGTSAALGNSEAFGPGGSANSNVLEMLNEIVGKEMPGESPVDPTSKTQQMWDQLQKGLSSQRENVQPYIDTPDTKTNNPPVSVPSASASTSQTSAPTVNSKPKNESVATLAPVYNLTGLAKVSTKAKEGEKLSIANDSTSTVVTSSPLKTTNANIKSQSGNTSPTNIASTPTHIEIDDDQPISEDMVKFLKGIKFVVSQEPGNDIILGKKFTDNNSPVARSFKEENGVMKNVVFERNSHLKNFKREKSKRMQAKARDNILRRHMKKRDIDNYREAVKILEKASAKLKDSIAKKSTEIAISSILKILKSEEQKTGQAPTRPSKDILVQGEMANALSEKYFEAARVLGTASKRIVDPMAKKTAEIAIACILKVIALSQYSVSKKHAVPLRSFQDDIANFYLANIARRHKKRNVIAANDVANKLKGLSKH